MTVLFPDFQGNEKVLSDYHAFLFILSLYANYNDEGVRKSIYTLIQSCCHEELGEQHYSIQSIQSIQSIWNPIIFLLVNAVSQEHSHIVQQDALRALLAIRQCVQSERIKITELKEEKFVKSRQSVCKQSPSYTSSSTTRCCYCHQECISNWVLIEYLFCPCNTQTTPLIDIRIIQDVMINPMYLGSTNVDSRQSHQKDDLVKNRIKTNTMTTNDNDNDNELEKGWAFWKQDSIDLDMVDICSAILSPILSNHTPSSFSPIGKQRWLMRHLLSIQEHQQTFLSFWVSG